MSETNGTASAPESATRGCDAFSWCAHGIGHPEDHVGVDRFHASESVPLALGGWAAYITQMDDESQPRLVFLGDETITDVTLPAGEAAALMAAVETPRRTPRCGACSSRWRSDRPGSKRR